MGFYPLDELVEKVTRTKEDLALQTINGEYLKIQYFDHEADWHSEDRDEFFICLDGTVEFSVEDKNYVMKRGDLIVIEAGKRHRANSSGSVLLSVEPHKKGR
ncbi:MAG: cupin domain-containing protein [Dehalococcoidia bacterium]|nr:MAG: cupin domain-containing protein [Dehalococcoidia bacterium]